MISLQKDPDGWSIIPSTPDRTIYVDNAGNDITGDGSEGNPYQTIQKACQEAVDGQSTHIILSENQSFTGNLNDLHGKSGKSNTEPIIIMTKNWNVNGASVGRATLADSGVKLSGTTSPDHDISMVAFIGIEITVPGYDGSSPGDVINKSGTAIFTDFYFEDVYMHDCGQVGNVTSDTSYRAFMDFYRCVFDTMYLVGSNNECLYGDGAKYTVKECHMIHGGWHDTNKPRSIFVRNLYCQPLSDVKCVGSGFYDGASENQMRGFAEFVACIVEHTPNMLAICRGFSGDPHTFPRADGFNGIIKKAVFTDGIDLDVSNPRACEVNMSNFSPERRCLIDDVIIQNDSESSGTGGRGIRVQDLDDLSVTDPDILNNGINNLTIRKLITHNIRGPAIEMELDRGSTGTFDNIVIEECALDITNSNNPIVKQTGTASITYRNNKYHHQNKLQTDGSLMHHNGIDKTLAQWIADVEPTAQWFTPSYPDPGRNIPRYYREVLGNPTNGSDDLDRLAYYDLLRSNRKSSWDTRLLPANLITWIRQGYGMSLNTRMRVSA